MKYLLAIFIVIATLFTFGYLIGKPTNQNSPVGGSNVSISGTQQVITITAKGGYQPRNSMAKSGVPTILRFNTSGTFDCSSSIRIPSLGIVKMLPPSGSTDIDLGVQPVGTLRGSCGMGMYPFSINFN